MKERDQILRTKEMREQTNETHSGVGAIEENKIGCITWFAKTIFLRNYVYSIKSRAGEW